MLHGCTQKRIVIVFRASFNQLLPFMVFDRAEESIKYMVLTNTWPRFVDAELRLVDTRGHSWTGCTMVGKATQ